MNDTATSDVISQADGLKKIEDLITATLKKGTFGHGPIKTRMKLYEDALRDCWALARKGQKA